MKRAALMVAVAALCVAGAAEAQDRSGGLIGSGTRTEDSGQMMGSGNAVGQTLGSGGFTTSTQASQVMGSGARSEETSPIFGSGGYLGNGGYLGSGLSIREVRLSDDSSLLVMSSDKGTFLIPIER